MRHFKRSFGSKLRKPSSNPVGNVIEDVRCQFPVWL